MGVSCPHTAHPPSTKRSGDVSSHQPCMTVSFSFLEGGAGGKSGGLVLSPFLLAFHCSFFFCFCSETFFEFSLFCFSLLRDASRPPYHFLDLSEFVLTEWRAKTETCVSQRAQVCPSKRK